ncbi:MAG: PEGA domain-containing protein [Planctomycetes bacterium]|nr:PEGA domain-containing protein [Planctomycetota bacterium]
MIEGSVVFATRKTQVVDHKSSLVLCLVATLLLTGCVERRLTINTEPQGAIVTLNDQEIGVSPVTVPFNWYGDYWVRISKDGYETLNTHRKLKSPLYDHPPLDFFAEILYPGRIVNAYEWTFDLAVKQYPSRDELIEQGQSLRTKTP